MIQKIGKRLACIFLFNDNYYKSNPVVEFTKWLIEHGISPPWIYSKERCIEYWKTQANNDLGNQPQDYLNKETRINDYLNWVMEVNSIPKGVKILEIGCNVGTNLNEMKKNGYGNIYGIEVNEATLPIMKKSYPGIDLKNIFFGEANEVLSDINSNSFDFVFTMAVSMHIHPTDNKMFNHMVRVSKKYICIIEPEHASYTHGFPRNYERVFERIGCEQIFSDTVDFKNYEGFTLRLFIKKDPSKILE